ncbi:MAG: tRNA preQ1(34) S-adenosylmethionine ribosyltransferase-isomerase QueA [Deltaproteobacteria bacterium]|jgi:S-adenosylmethionine:tRNA ribosyltransferase-isomerase|nr:tRNA preQ1(34) S-adenosylmethionine ribosyltransferase-isomerase QueA [Deltaproteobacteria bacterium]
MSFDLNDYAYELPQGLIAQEPAPDRASSRLMVVDRSYGTVTLASFREIGGFLPPGALIVLNDAKVTPARLLGHKKNSAGKVELLILEPPLSPEAGPRDCECLGKPGRSLRPGTELTFKNGPSELPALVLSAQGGSARRLVRFFFKDPPLAVLGALGHVPLPPYVKRPDRDEDFERYQTVYAKSPGAVAAPTAGLHFTPALLADLKTRHPVAEITLRVGAGTFAPLTPDQLSQGRLHAEFVEVGEVAALAVREAQSRGERVLAVGTTSARALEWAAEGGHITPRRGECDLFIRPGHEFGAVGAMITNFHLPGSSLALLVGAFMGRPLFRKAYDLAVAEGFRFYSYGDAMLIL